MFVLLRVIFFSQFLKYTKIILFILGDFVVDFPFLDLPGF